MTLRFLTSRSARAGWLPALSLQISRPLSCTAATANQWLKAVERVKHEAGIAEIDGATLEQWLEDPTADVRVVDVREREEQARGIIPGALCLPRGIVDRDIGRFVPVEEEEEGQVRLVFYCAGGVRSILAAESVKRLGYQNAISLRGGMHSWQLEGRPVVKVQ